MKESLIFEVPFVLGSRQDMRNKTRAGGEPHLPQSRDSRAASSSVADDRQQGSRAHLGRFSRYQDTTVLSL